MGAQATAWDADAAETKCVRSGQSFDEEKLESFGKQSPMTRPAQPREFAPAYVFLASKEASYINGEVLGVTGGRPLA